MTDVFDRFVGQDRVAASLRQYALTRCTPIFSVDLRERAFVTRFSAFAAALQCPRHGCGECEICRLVLSEQDADVYFAERSGSRGGWRRFARPSASRGVDRLGAGYQIVVIEDVELTTTGASLSAPALLSLSKSPRREPSFS